MLKCPQAVGFEVPGDSGDTTVGVDHLRELAHGVIRIRDCFVGRVGHVLLPVQHVIGGGVRPGGVLHRNPVADGIIDECRPCAVGVLAAGRLVDGVVGGRGAISSRVDAEVLSVGGGVGGGLRGRCSAFRGRSHCR